MGRRLAALLLVGALVAIPSFVSAAGTPAPSNAVDIMWSYFCADHPEVTECSPTPSPG